MAAAYKAFFCSWCLNCQPLRSLKVSITWQTCPLAGVFQVGLAVLRAPAMLTMACCLNCVCCVEGVFWEWHLTEVATHHLSQRGHAQLVVVMCGTVNLVLVDGDT
jgi:hypothetical protein